MHLPTFLAFVGILPLLASAHMRMLEPLPINSPDDPEVPDNLKDYEYTAPLDASGSNFPCKGYHEEETSHVSKATYQAGGAGKLTIQANSATHGGGSCQISLSYDNGATWKVIKSMIGGCPVTLEYDFTIPQEAPSSDDVLLAWTWFNLVGNREMYMNCARVNIEASVPGRHRRAEIAQRDGELSSLPDMFTCNIGQGCTTKENENVEFPEPGDDVLNGENSMRTEEGTGVDGASAASGSSGGSGGSGGSDAPASAAPEPSSPAASPPSDGDTDSGQPSAPATSNAVVPVTDGGSESPAAPSTDSPASSPFVSPPEMAAPESSAPASSEPAPSAPSAPAPSASAAPASSAATASPAGGSCSDGSIICDSATTWSMCVNGAPVSMGAVAAGTSCVDGTIS